MTIRGGHLAYFTLIGDLRKASREKLVADFAAGGECRDLVAQSQ